MKLNVSYPAHGSQKLIEIEDDRKIRGFMDKRMGNEVPADTLGDEWKGYVWLGILFAPNGADQFRCSKLLGATTSKVSP